MSTELNNIPGDTAAAIEAGKTIAGATIKEIEGVPVSVVPDGFRMQLHKDLMQTPVHTEQHPQLETAESFIEYFNRFSDDNSAIFCNVDTAYFLAIIDYHKEDSPAWCKHKVAFQCQRTHEWWEWKNNSGSKMGQLDFAYFIEENLEEIISPPGAEMLEIATTLKANTKVNFTSGKSLANGQTQIQYMEDIQGSGGAKGQLKIPEIFKLGMRIFEGGDAYKLEARFRYRIKEGHLTMWYDLVRPHKVVQAAVEDVYQKIKKDCKCQLLIHGKPE